MIRCPISNIQYRHVLVTDSPHPTPCSHPAPLPTDPAWGGLVRGESLCVYFHNGSKILDIELYVYIYIYNYIHIYTYIYYMYMCVHPYSPLPCFPPPLCGRPTPKAVTAQADQPTPSPNGAGGPRPLCGQKGRGGGPGAYIFVFERTHH